MKSAFKRDETRQGVKCISSESVCYTMLCTFITRSIKGIVFCFESCSRALFLCVVLVAFFHNFTSERFTFASWNAVWVKIPQQEKSMKNFLCFFRRTVNMHMENLWKSHRPGSFQRHKHWQMLSSTNTPTNHAFPLHAFSHLFRWYNKFSCSLMCSSSGFNGEAAREL